MSVANARDWPYTLAVAARLASFAIICGLLYWGKVVLIPVALAALVSALLSPLVTRLGKLGLPRVTAVIVIVSITTGAIAAVGWIVGGQLAELGRQLPSYEQNIKAKIADLRSMLGGGALEGVQNTIKEINKEIEGGSTGGRGGSGAGAGAAGAGGGAGTAGAGGTGAAGAGTGAAGAGSGSGAGAVTDSEAGSATGSEAGSATDSGAGSAKPVPVEIRPTSGLIGEVKLLGPIVDAAATAALVMLLSIFMLVKREDLRDRFVSLAGQPALVSTTKAFAEVGDVISRYLLTQFLVNASIGLAVWLGLYLIGVPYSALWGLAAGVLRYVPYVGPTVALLLPATVSIVTSPGWEQVLLVLGLFALIEALANYFLEPLAYGHSVGLTAIAVIMAAVFWTWLWGGVGLVLATPLTACLVVLGRYFPALAPLDRLLGERPALAPHQALYQRLLARDGDEAVEILEQHLAEHSLTETCDDLMLGALVLLKRDLIAGTIGREEGEVVADSLREMTEDLASGQENAAPAARRGAGRVRVAGFPVRDELDEIALELLRAVVGRDSCELQILSSDQLVGERIGRVEALSPSVVCVVSIGPGDLTSTRYAVKRLRTRLPDLGLVVGRLGADDAAERDRQLARAAGVSRVAGSLEALRAALLPVVHAIEPTTPTADDHRAESSLLS